MKELKIIAGIPPKILIENEEIAVEALLLCYFNSKETKSLRLWSDRMFIGNMQKFVLDIIDSTKYLATQAIPGDTDIDTIIYKEREEVFNNIHKIISDHFKNEKKRRKECMMKSEHSV